MNTLSTSQYRELLATCKYFGCEDHCQEENCPLDASAMSHSECPRREGQYCSGQEDNFYQEDKGI